MSAEEIWARGNEES